MKPIGIVAPSAHQSGKNEISHETQDCESAPEDLPLHAPSLQALTRRLAAAAGRIAGACDALHWASYETLRWTPHRRRTRPDGLPILLQCIWMGPGGPRDHRRRCGVTVNAPSPEGSAGVDRQPFTSLDCELGRRGPSAARRNLQLALRGYTDECGCFRRQPRLLPAEG